MKTFALIIILLILTASMYMAVLEIRRDRRIWNGGKCPDCDIRWKIWDYAEDGSRGYCCRKCGRLIRITEHVEHDGEGRR